MIQRILNKLHVDPVTAVNSDNDINFYVKLENLSNIKQDEHLLRKIVSEHVISATADRKINISCYFKPLKLSSLFSTRPKRPDLMKANVVYRFECQEDSCNASYIGHTTNTLQKRSSQHRYHPSSIFKHYDIEHNRPVPINNVLCNQFSVIYQFSNPVDLKIAEAISIREEKPYINVKYNEMFCHLNLYK